MASTAFDKDKLAFKDKNGKLYTRLYLATSDCPDGFSSNASQVVKSFAPIWPEEVGDGRGAFLPMESKHRVDGAFRMQELQDQLGSLAMTADDKFDYARSIQQLRLISTELNALGDKVVPTRKTHAFLKALPDKHYGSFKTVLLCEKPRDGSAALDVMMSPMEPPHTMPCRFAAKSPLMMVQ